jgi:hypothetical protein
MGLSQVTKVSALLTVAILLTFQSQSRSAGLPQALHFWRFGLEPQTMARPPPGIASAGRLHSCPPAAETALRHARPGQPPIDAPA